ncbi:hypothetical protein [Marinimicrobium sp. ABcell2]|uniref:hypothetical protein n=1 Tax=Marinimicrobium sp. ABcell2 TaxID=3069751 RepID=UPI0027AFA9A1|nr:hypothetical protein [Marinimicrobium sp. ABcell2]MDQ2077442.1 hypothetical protein [Marinimicrobium sp. ABcell2]
MTRTKGPRIHKRTMTGITVKAYNDSGADWVVWSDESSLMPVRLPQRTFTMSRAMEFFIGAVLAEQSLQECAENPEVAEPTAKLS